MNTFFIGNKTFTEKNEHHVHDDEHSVHETNSHRSRTKANNMQEISNRYTMRKTPNTSPLKQSTKKKRS